MPRNPPAAAATIFAKNILRPCRIGGARIEIEAPSLVSHLHYEHLFIHAGADPHVFFRALAVTPENGIGQGFGQRHRHIQSALSVGVR